MKIADVARTLHSRDAAELCKGFEALGQILKTRAQAFAGSYRAPALHQLADDADELVQALRGGSLPPAPNDRRLVELHDFIGRSLYSAAHSTFSESGILDTGEFLEPTMLAELPGDRVEAFSLPSLEELPQPASSKE